MMGNHFVRISVPDWVQVHQRPWKCWQTLQIAYSYSVSPRNNSCRCLHSGTTGLITSYCRAAWKRYPLLSKLSQMFHQIWLAPKKWRVNCLKSYWNRRQGLSVEGDCALWGIRVIVPKKLQNEVLREFHREYQGIARMKAKFYKELCVVAWKNARISLFTLSPFVFNLFSTSSSLSKCCSFVTPVTRILSI